MTIKKTWTKPVLKVFRAGGAESGPANNISDGANQSRS
jgi:hypothetical protein